MLWLLQVLFIYQNVRPLTKTLKLITVIDREKDTNKWWKHLTHKILLYKQVNPRTIFGMVNSLLGTQQCKRSKVIQSLRDVHPRLRKRSAFLNALSPHFKQALIFIAKNVCHFSTKAPIQCSLHELKILKKSTIQNINNSTLLIHCTPTHMTQFAHRGLLTQLATTAQ